MNHIQRCLILSFFLFSISIVAQETEENLIKSEDSLKLNHFALGIKIGIPNIVGGSAEIVLPVLNNHFAPFLDYNNFSLTFSDLEANLSSIGYGAKYYFGEKGNGFFISLGRSALKTDIVFNELLFVDNVTKQSTTGTGKTELQLNTTDFKVGIKTGGTIYFLFELGYGLGDIPDTLNFTATSDGITESFSEDIPPLPGLGSNGILIGNVGFGIAF